MIRVCSISFVVCNSIRHIILDDFKPDCNYPHKVKSIEYHKVGGLLKSLYKCKEIGEVCSLDEDCCSKECCIDLCEHFCCWNFFYSRYLFKLFQMFRLDYICNRFCEFKISWKQIWAIKNDIKFFLRPSRGSNPGPLG